jgi:hypothetical protein
MPAGDVTQVAPEVESDPRVRSRRFRLSVADAAFAVVIVAAVVYYVRQSRGYGFRSDDWLLVSRGWTVADYFKPYNDALSIVQIAVYHLLFETFGFGSYVPFRLMAIGTSTGVGLAMFLVVRSSIGPGPALVAGTAMLWYPGFGVVVPNMNHYLAVTACITCAWLLRKTGSAADIALALALGLALCASGAGIAGAAACLVYLALAGAARQRWLAVIVPTAAWVAWWRIAPRRARARPSLHDGATTVLDGVRASFRGLVAESAVLGALLGIFFVGLLVARLRNGRRASCNQLAWTAALVSWWSGLAVSRSGAIAGAFRYQLVGSAFVLLAFLPSQPQPRVPRSWRRIARGNAHAVRVALLGVAILVAGLIVVMNHGGIEETSRSLAFDHRLVRQRLIIANLGPEFFPDRVGINMGGASGSLPAGQVRELIAKYGAPPGTRPSEPDAALVRLGRIHARIGAVAPTTRCAPIAPSSPLPPTSQLLIGAPDHRVVVEIRRFAREWVPIGTIPRGEVASVDLPGLHAETRWEIRAPGACIYAGATIQLPEPRATVRATTLIVAVPNGDAPLRTVEFRVTGGGISNSRVGAARSTRGAWFVVWDTTTLPNGRYVLTAVVTDSDGHTGSSAPVDVTVDN